MYQTATHDPIVLFALDEQPCALPLRVVERVVRAVAITPVPTAPPIVLGVINVRGAVLPVVDVRRRFHQPARELDPSHRFILARTATRRVVLIVDAVTGVRVLADHQVTSADRALPFAPHLRGVARMEDGLALIYDLDRFLSLDEERALDASLAGGAP